MSMSLPIEERGNPRSSGYKRNVNDWYVEPASAVHKLLDVEVFVGSILDPACGGGNIVDVCESRGFIARGFDLVDRANGRFMSIDFLKCKTEPENIITNPPFNLATEFTLKALSMTAFKVCILARLAWLEGEHRGRAIFDGGRLARVWVFRKRISMPPGGTDVQAKSGSVAFAWYVFDVSHTGPATIGWL